MDKYTQEIFLNDNTPELPIVEKPEVDTKNTYINYIVEPGDTLWAISIKYGTTVNEIIALNDIVNPNLIYPGQNLRILTNSTIEGNQTNNLNNVIYTVKKGDTLYRIANMYGVTISQIVNLNNIANPNLIYPGQRLRIKSLSTAGSVTTNVYKVKRGDNLWRISRRFGVTVNYLVELNNIENPNLIYAGQLLFI